MAETPMQGLAEWLRMEAMGQMGVWPNRAVTLDRWASEVEAARASPADTRSEREKFEAWADVKYPLVNKLRPGDPLRGYSANMKSCAWDGWQAARASLPAPLPDEWLKEAERLIESYADGPHTEGYYGARRAELLAHLRARHGADTDRARSDEKKKDSQT